MIFNNSILIIDDDETICNLLQKILLKNNISSLIAHNTDNALELLQYFSFDLILLDYMLPKENGIDFIKTLNNLKYNTPIIMLTASNEIDTKINAFELGAFDYIVKPFNSAELFLRINKVITINNKINNANTNNLETINFNYIEKKLTIKNKNIELTDNESNIFNFFWQNANKILTKEDILHFLNKEINEINENNLNVSIMRLRKKIETLDPANNYLKTIRYKGFIFEK